MKFSVVIPTYNRKDILRHCIEAATKQDYPDYEVIVADDGSTDGTEEMVRREFPQVRYIRQEVNRGPAAARNRGIQAATGDFVAFTDDDCVPPPDWLARLAQGFIDYPQAAAVGGIQEAPEQVLRTHILARYERFVTRKVYGLGKAPVIGSPAPGGTNNLAIRRQVLLEVGGFDETFPMAAGEDADLLRRLAQRGYVTVTLPLKVNHLQAYTWTSFFRQQIRRGIGAAYYHHKWEELPSAPRDILRLFLAPLVWARDTLRYHSPRMAAIHALATTLQAWGRLQGRRHITQAVREVRG